MSDIFAFFFNLLFERLVKNTLINFILAANRLLLIAVNRLLSIYFKIGT